MDPSNIYLVLKTKWYFLACISTLFSSPLDFKLLSLDPRKSTISLTLGQVSDTSSWKTRASSASKKYAYMKKSKHSSSARKERVVFNPQIYRNSHEQYVPSIFGSWVFNVVRQGYHYSSSQPLIQRWVQSSACISPRLQGRRYLPVVAEAPRLCRVQPPVLLMPTQIIGQGLGFCFKSSLCTYE